ncbi:MarR family winged helix-turn-helix transcriptional regulator [Nocardia brevicatena]|uniref:MarR family winged helix-turn-helix transcriptional regulator n=1 Tax=Nocardia brevicatena TaxID=37327 RepID=UPI0002F35078|nr:MarR family transcriptional regulator [Nocardia brevicatena]
MSALADNPGIPAAALARACVVTPQVMTVVLKNLQERGLIERTPHPWRRGVLETQLIETGRAAFEAADRKAVAIERRIANAFTEQERATFRNLLTHFAAAAREKPTGESTSGPGRYRPPLRPR